MSLMKAAGKWGSIFVLVALLITLVKSLIAFVGFVTVAIKVLIVVVFGALLLGVGYLVLKGVTGARGRKAE